MKKSFSNQIQPWHLGTETPWNRPHKALEESKHFPPPGQAFMRQQKCRIHRIPRQPDREDGLDRRDGRADQLRRQQHRMLSAVCPPAKPHRR